jgi:Zinc carboxypeptidase
VRPIVAVRLAFSILAGSVAFGVAAAPAHAQQIPTPEDHFGHVMGADKELARWDDILEYFSIVAAGSDRVMVDTAGPTTNGNPFVVVTISAPENLARLDEIRASSRDIAEGRISRAEAEAIAASIPATAFINHNIHSTEIGSSQTSVQLVHDLAAGTDDTTLEILDNVVTVLIPSANPDGQIMVTDWYRRNVGTEYERARMPWLYHHYAGHDNNRDFFQATLTETRYWMKQMYHETYPQLYLDQHQMGTSGPRIFVPPYPDPMNPDIHPLQWQQLRFIGGGMVADLQAEQKQGVVTGSMYRIWGQEGALTGRYHNIVALLTETASARIASPDTVGLEALERGAAPGRGLGEYGFQMAFVDPWMGGEWTLGDIVDYQMIAATSYLEQAARFKDHYVMGRWQMASETIERGENEGPGAYVIPIEQRDAVAAAELVGKLMLQGIEVYRATEAFDAVAQTDVWDTPAEGTLMISDPEDDEGASTGDSGNDSSADDGGDDDESGDEGGERDSDDADDRTAAEAADEPAPPRTFPAGSWVVFGAQPSRAAVLDLLEPRNRRLQREWPEGPFVRSYDGAAYTMPLQMGVEAIRIDSHEVGTVEPATSAAIVAPPVPDAREWYALNMDVTRSFQAATRLLDAGIPVSKAETDQGPRFLVPASATSARAALSEISSELGLTVSADPAGVRDATPQIASRVGLYQGWAGAMDEGWTRLVLEEFEYPYQTLSNDDVRAPELGDRFDVIILPSEISLTRLIDGSTSDETPPEFRGGIGEEGVDNLQAFVRAGGTLVTLERADELVMERFDVPVRNAVAGVGPDELFLPTSLLRMELDGEHPLTMGSPPEVAGKWGGGRAYEPTGFGGEAGRIRVVGRWAEDPDRVLMSGMLYGADLLAGKGAILDVEYGSGRILMYGLRVQHRGQTHGTFKLLFNALLKNAPRPATQ